MPRIIRLSFLRLCQKIITQRCIFRKCVQIRSVTQIWYELVFHVCKPGIRKRRDLSQQVLAEKSNVSYGSIKRFETTGQISLISLTKLCIALDCVDEIKNLFTNVAYDSIEEVLRENK